MHKLTFLLLFFIFLNLTRSNSQNSISSLGHKIKSIDPDSINFEDLTFLKETIGDAQLVILGEQTHGEGSTFHAKTRLIKFLHEKMGFNVLAFESGLYDCAKIWEQVKKGKKLKDEAIGNLFYMYATSEQMYPLFDYMQKNATGKNELKLAGFESQHSGKKSMEELFPDLFAFLEQHHISASTTDKTLVQQLSLSNFKMNPPVPLEKEQNKYFEVIKNWAQAIKGINVSGTKLTERSDFWVEVLNSITSQAYRYWKLKGAEFYKDINHRDKQMADNLIWLADTYFKGEKVIVWAHNIHIAKSANHFQFADTNATKAFNQAVPMGNHIHTYFKNKAYFIGFTAHKGAYMDYGNGKIATIPESLPGTLENHFRNEVYCFIDFTKAPADNPIWQNQRGRFLDFNEGSVIWPKVFDGLFFINTAFPVIRK